MNYKNMLKRETKVIAYVVICLTLVVIGVSYAMFLQVNKNTDNQVVETGSLVITYKNGNGEMIQDNACLEPMTDEDASIMIECSYQLSILNSGSLPANYKLNIFDNLEGLSGNEVFVSHDILRVGLKKGVETLNPFKIETLSNLPHTDETASETAQNNIRYILDTGVLEPGENITYSVQIWLNDDKASTALSNQFVSLKIEVDSVVAENVDVGNDNSSEIKGFFEEKVVTNGEGVYKVEHPDSELTEAFSNDLSEAQKNNLKQIEYRYAGANPNNYVTFNNELWRVIGLVNTPEGQRIKIIRNESIGEYSWDSSDSSTNDGYGINEWSQADIMHLLNDGPYYNRTSGICYNAQNNATIDCDFSNSGLSDQAKNMIETITWNTGSNDVATHTYEHINTTEFYSFERSGNTGKVCNSGTYCNDTLTRTTTWKGMIGLMYSSDYGYATSGGTTINRISCLNSELYNWNNSEDCYQNNWLNNSSISQWIISPIADADLAHSSFVVGVNKRVGNGIVAGARGVKPTLFLKSNIKIVDGLGTQENPYQLKA